MQPEDMPAEADAEELGISIEEAASAVRIATAAMADMGRRSNEARAVEDRAMDRASHRMWREEWWGSAVVDRSSPEYAVAQYAFHRNLQTARDVA